MSLKFKIDENLPVEAVDALVSAGHDALTVMDQGLEGEMDWKIASVSQQEQRVILTLDLDFGDIRTYPPQDYAGIIVLRLRRQDRYQVLDTLTRVVQLAESEALNGKLWIVEENRVRIRE